MIPFLSRLFDRKTLSAKKVMLGGCAALLLGFGRASALWWLAPITSLLGFTFAFLTIRQSGFRAGWIVFTIALLFQSSWLLSHPYGYIVGVWILLSLLLALSYATIGWLFVRDPKHNLLSTAGWAACFTLLEWGYTCLPCGYSFQCAALALSWSLWPLQLASLIGAIGLSFCVFWTNTLAFTSIVTKKRIYGVATVTVALIPYLSGGLLYTYRTEQQQAFDTTHTPQKVAFCHMEEPPDVTSKHLSPWKLHEQEWHKIFPLLSTIQPHEVSLVVLPEGAVPFSADSPLFSTEHLPNDLHRSSLAYYQQLSSLDIAQLTAQRIGASILIGLESQERAWPDTTVAHNSCFFVTPSDVERYDKQLLLPLGEYIPCAALRSWLAAYGIHDSFTAGTTSKIFTTKSLRIAPLICYEETFSCYALHAAVLNPTLLVSLSNDCWYPTIGREHFELARLRAAEVGLPLIRSCNQGVSAAVDALGRIVAVRGMDREKENVCVITPLSQYTAPSMYAAIGSTPFIILLAALSIGVLAKTVLFSKNE